MGRTGRPAQSAAWQASRIHQSADLRLARAQQGLQRHHAREQRIVLRRPRLGPMHRARLTHRNHAGHAVREFAMKKQEKPAPKENPGASIDPTAPHNPSGPAKPIDPSKYDHPAKPSIPPAKQPTY